VDLYLNFTPVYIHRVHTDKFTFMDRLHSVTVNNLSYTHTGFKPDSFLSLIQILRIRMTPKLATEMMMMMTIMVTMMMMISVDKKNQLDVTFCILYFSSNSCSTCFGQPCSHHQELTTA
jgi:hypothetical protein